MSSRGIEQRTWIALMVVAAAACSNHQPTALVDELLVPGAPARVVYDEVAWVGGHGSHTTTVIDSAGSRYSVTSCGDRALGGPCVEGTGTRTGAVAPGLRDQLFQRAATGAFRALRPSYSMPNGDRPPDAAAWSLTVTANGRQRTITWERGALIPGVLSSYACTVAVARGDLIICGM